MERNHTAMMKRYRSLSSPSGLGMPPRRSPIWSPSRSASNIVTTRSQAPTRFPLSSLPTVPSLRILSFLSGPGRSFIFNVDRNPILHSILRKTFYDQFCAGETGPETRQCVRSLKDLGFNGVILTYARETVFDHQTNTQHEQGVDSPKDGQSASDEKDVYCHHIDAWRKGTLETLELIENGDYLALKLTGAGPGVTETFAAGRSAPQPMMDALRDICTACEDRSIRVIVDAESQRFQLGIDQTTLELMREFNHHGVAVVYNTYQAYLKRTAAVLADHLLAANRGQFTLGLKLVRGAYMYSDDRSLIHDTKQDTDNAYNGIAEGALKQCIGIFGAKDGPPFPPLNLFLASHNKASVLGAHRLHQDRAKSGLPTVPVAYGQLHGMSDEVSFSLLQETDNSQVPAKVYKCTTWGSTGECLAYLLRRAVENRDAVMRTTDEYTALKLELWRRLKSVYSYFPLGS
ncbi:FAD-linked oxidoreductase-like protein [Xylariales sp. AK1849]|nr:FAD-linked oxidoreductase-like protein [Xylariales sp. AK1849]